MPTGRIAFGVNPERSYTNEAQAVIEDKNGISGDVEFNEAKGRFTWRLAGAPTTIRGPFLYRNRFSLGLGAAMTKKPRTNLIAQRVYHWINWINYEEVHGAAWYPTNALIDAMVANHATMLVLHEHWMEEEGDNGKPHANYLARDKDALARMIDHAHEKGLRVGVYCRGIERYAPSVGFFEKHLRRNWDGLYVDWSSAYNISNHESRHKPDALLGDAHLTADGVYACAREWFLYAKQLRKLVGPKGFLIHHQGFGTTGILANLVADAYLPGESPLDHRMFNNRDDADFQGMLGGVACMPWTIDAPGYVTPDGVAKMAAWGFYPHACLAFQRDATPRQPSAMLFPADPNAPANAYVLPYWRVLATVDAERCELFNSPAVNLVAAVSSNPNIECLVYKQTGNTPDDEAYLVVAVNLGDKPVSATITLQPEILGMSGKYRAARIDSATSKVEPLGQVTHVVETAELAPRQIEGLKLTKSAE